MKKGFDKNSGGSKRRFSGIAKLGSRILYALVVAGGVFLVAGFTRYYTIVAGYDNSDKSKTDGIVALTGGNNRIETALDLLRQGRAKRMLISGVHAGTSKKAIGDRFDGYDDLFSCCIDLDHMAKDTIENGIEAAKWIGKLGFESVIVVTSDYHMPRAMMEMSRAMPDIFLVPHAVRSRSHIGSGDAIAGESERLRILLREYVKMIATSLNKS